MRARFLSLFASLILALGLAAVALPAHAAPIALVCNNSASVDYIVAYNDSVGFTANIGPGFCVSVNDTGGNARVDVDRSGGAADVDSWKKRPGTTGLYGPCYNNETEASNPYSGGSPSTYTTQYRTYSATGC